MVCDTEQLLENLSNFEFDTKKIEVCSVSVNPNCFKQVQVLFKQLIQV